MRGGSAATRISRRGAGQGGAAEHRADLGPEPAAGDERQPLDPLGELPEELHRDAAAERVADDRRRADADRDEQVADRRRVGAERVVAARRRRVAVADQVGGDDRVAVGQPHRDLAPVARGVDHAVDQDHRRAAAGGAVDTRWPWRSTSQASKSRVREALCQAGTLGTPTWRAAAALRIVRHRWPRSSSKGVVKTFGPITAVDGLDLDVPEGICLGLLGPNGAGKSTTMRLLTGQAIADSGRAAGARLRAAARGEGGAGRDGRRAAARQPRHRRHRRGQPRASSPASTGSRTSTPRSTARSRSPGSRDRRHDAVDELSGGMRRRLLLARGLVHDPKLILLDEPTVGLDPQIRTEVWDADRRPARAGHDDPDVDPLHRGGRAARRRGRADGRRARSIARGTPADLIAEHAGERDRRGLRRRPSGSPRSARDGRGGRASRSAPAGPAVAIVGSERATDGAVPEDAVIRRAASLEDVFVLLTGEELE